MHLFLKIFSGLRAVVDSSRSIVADMRRKIWKKHNTKLIDMNTLMCVNQIRVFSGHHRRFSSDKYLSYFTALQIFRYKQKASAAVCLWVRIFGETSRILFLFFLFCIMFFYLEDNHVLNRSWLNVDAITNDEKFRRYINIYLVNLNIISSFVSVYFLNPWTKRADMYIFASCYHRQAY